MTYSYEKLDVYKSAWPSLMNSIRLSLHSLIMKSLAFLPSLEEP